MTTNRMEGTIVSESTDDVTDRAEANRQMWTDPGTVEFWRYWQYDWDHLVRPANDCIAAAAAIGPNHQVLDLGSGHGEPALSFSQVVAPAGHITATDLSAEMLSLAAENAGIARLTNITFKTADASNLPFPPASFDAVTSRFGAMYFPDPGQACAEVRRVLRPSGRAAFAVWGPASHVPWYAGAIEVLAQYLEMLSQEGTAPEPFRFGYPGSLASIFTRAGFANVRETSHELVLEWPRSLDSYVTFIEALHCGLIAQIPATHHQAIRDQFRAIFRAFEHDGTLRMPGTVIIVSGEQSA